MTFWTIRSDYQRARSRAVAVAIALLVLSFQNASASDFPFRITPVEGRPRIEPLAHITADGVTIPKDVSNPEGDKELLSWYGTESVTVVPPTHWSDKEGTLVIDDDGRDRQTSCFGKIRLRKGLHRFEIAYAHTSSNDLGNRSLKLDWKLPESSSWSEVPTAAFSDQPDWRWPDETRSPGFDDEGFRIPDQPRATKPGLGVRRHSWADTGQKPTRVEDLRQIPVHGYGGGIKKVRPPDRRHGAQMGAVVYGLIKAPADGEYRFRLTADGIAAMFIGDSAPRLAQVALPHHGDDWDVSLAYDGQITAPLKTFDDGVLCFASRHGPSEHDEFFIDIGVPKTLIKTMTRHNETSRDDWPETVAAEGQDILYAEGSSGDVRAVVGEAVAIRDEKFVFRYGGTERTLPLDRVLRVKFATSRYTSGAPPEKPVLLVGPPGSHRVPATLLGHEGFWAYKFAAIGVDPSTYETEGNTFALNRVTLRGIDVYGGGITNFADLNPQITSVGLFDLSPPLSTDEMPDGTPLRIGRTKFDHGYAAGPRTTFQCKLGRSFGRLKLNVGLSPTSNTAAAASITIYGDEDVLWQNSNLSSKDGLVVVEADVQSREKLTIEIDFGSHFDVGDIVVLGRPELLRQQTPQSLAATKALKESVP